ncbi:MAG: sigma-70 family RNA polymerase sigma factor [Alistipes sp.]|nr:sigma-70 family RNA polymerase sigma factor [Alistipes sp.]
MSCEEFEKIAVGVRGDLIQTAAHYLHDRDAAEDVVQDTLLKLFVMRSRLDAYRSVEALARTVVKHLSLNYIRDNRMSTAIDTATIAVSDERADDAELSAERLRRTLEMIDALPAKQSIIMRMKHVEGMEVEDIARAACCSADAVYAHLSRGRRAIVERFKQKGGL